MQKSIVVATPKMSLNAIYQFELLQEKGMILSKTFRRLITAQKLPHIENID